MPDSFSPNMLKTYELCQKKFYFQYILKLNVPRRTSLFEKGKKVHALANYYLQGFNVSEMETILNSSEQLAWQKLKQNSFYNKNFLKSEFSLLTKIGEFWTGGRIDAVVHDEGDYYILDYKTGSVPQNPEFDFQTMIYLLCLDRYLKEYKSLSFVYIALKEDKNYVIEFNEKHRELYAEKIQKICTKITQDKLYKCNLQNCGLCEFSKICPKE